MTLYLLPNLLGDNLNHELFLPQSVATTVALLDGVIAENEKVARRYLKMFTLKKPLQVMPICLLNEHTQTSDLECLIQPLLAGEIWGLLSDAGLPCIADPGSLLVALARKRGVAVKALVGPSSIVLALMLSGLPGQSFAFYGYIAKDLEMKKRELQLWEKRSLAEKQTAIFMQTPYRNEETFRTCLEVLSQETRLCVATELTLPTERVTTLTIGEWRKQPTPEIHKKPTLFLIHAF